MIRISEVMQDRMTAEMVEVGSKTKAARITTSEMTRITETRTIKIINRTSVTNIHLQTKTEMTMVEMPTPMIRTKRRIFENKNQVRIRTLKEEVSLVPHLDLVIADGTMKMIKKGAVLIGMQETKRRKKNHLL